VVAKREAAEPKPLQAKRLKPGSTIGIISPSHVAKPEEYARITAVLNRLGYKVKLGPNIYKNTWGYVASAAERAADLNTLVKDPTVDMVYFSGGESGVDILPYIDYESIKAHPKIFCSYSDGTSIVNAIYAQTGLVTYYGVAPGDFQDLRQYDYEQFTDHFIKGNPKEFVSDSVWKTLNGGIAEGILVGGYTSLFGLMLANKYFTYDAGKKYLLFLEDSDYFSNVGEVATYVSFIGQSAFMDQVTGLIFGHYADTVPENLLNYLERFGKSHDIPVVYTDDFGHGTKHAILPIGVKAKLNATTKRLTFRY